MCLKPVQTYRANAIGALLDESEKAIEELKSEIKLISNIDLSRIIDVKTEDTDCQSIQTILTHVVRSGYGYATSIHNLKGHESIRKEKTIYSSAEEYIQDLNKMFSFTETVFQEFQDHELEQLDNRFKIKTGWGQLYDVEQLTEHAIVHVMRHRRQIQKLKSKTGL
jgi:uncharacterized damage-inducible protein DinB